MKGNSESFISVHGDISVITDDEVSFAFPGKSGCKLWVFSENFLLKKFTCGSRLDGRNRLPETIKNKADTRQKKTSRFSARYIGMRYTFIFLTFVFYVRRQFSENKIFRVATVTNLRLFSFFAAALRQIFLSIVVGQSGVDSVSRSRKTVFFFRKWQARTDKFILRYIIKRRRFRAIC